jgi:prepilin-type N-terminal cleavage/methylation domain-containing protein
MADITLKSPRRRSHRVNGGFTLIELIAVIVVLAILAGAAVPTLTVINSSRSAMAGKQLLRDLSFARQRAVATGTRCWVVVNANTETWSVLAENPVSPGRAGATIITDMATGKPFTIILTADEYQGAAIASCNFDDASEVGFDWLGKPLNSASAALSADGTITLNDGGQIQVRAHTGHVKYVAP